MAFDIHGVVRACIKHRVQADYLIDKSLFKISNGDGRDMPFEMDSFGHILRYDSLHHIHQAGLKEFRYQLRSRKPARFPFKGAVDHNAHLHRNMNPELAFLHRNRSYQN